MPETVTAATLREWPLPPPGGDKEARGRSLVVGGSAMTPGAVLLAGEAALRCGAGKLQVATAASVAPAVAAALPEALVMGLPETPDGDIDPDGADRILALAQQCASVLLGPGINDVEVARALLGGVVPELATTLVIDAVALAYVTGQPEVLHHLHGDVVLTPNPHELALTLSVPDEEVEADAAEATRRLAVAAQAAVACGGESSWVGHPDGRLWLNQTGGVGLGVSGSGDVLAGIVLGLTARGADPAQAAVWASYVHGRAGDRLAASVGRLGFLARELLPEVPRVLAEIEV